MPRASRTTLTHAEVNRPAGDTGPRCCNRVGVSGVNISVPPPLPSPLEPAPETPTPQWCKDANNTTTVCRHKTELSMYSHIWETIPRNHAFTSCKSSRQSPSVDAFTSFTSSRQSPSVDAFTTVQLDTQNDSWSSKCPVGHFQMSNWTSVGHLIPYSNISFHYITTESWTRPKVYSWTPSWTQLDTSWTPSWT